MTDPQREKSSILTPSRRDFIGSTAALAGVASTLSLSAGSAYAGGSDSIRVGLIGCGGRGTGAAEQSVSSSSGVKLVAMGDMFPDRLAAARENLSKLGDKVEVHDDHCFTGFDAYQKVIASDVDLIILATPPGFRPIHLKAAIDAGKHVFTEKPVAVDGPGIRSVLESAKKAKEKNLAVVAGTQRRHEAGYVAVMKAVHDGLIGEVVAARAYWNQGPLWNKPREEKWTDMEWQLRNWLYFTWLSGDHICEQHVHNLDVINWAMGGPPVKAVAMGGREVRKGKEYGQIFDHFAVDYEYASGAHMMSMARQIEGCENNVSEALVGTKGGLHLSPGTYRATKVDFRFRGRERNPYEQEHIDMIESIRSGKPLNELKTVAESTLTAIMGRMSAYTGKAITYEQALNSKESLIPDKLAFGPLPTPPVAIPGVTPFV